MQHHFPTENAGSGSPDPCAQLVGDKEEKVNGEKDGASLVNVDSTSEGSI